MKHSPFECQNCGHRPTPEEVHRDVAVGLIDSIITAARVLRNEDLSSAAAQEALTNLRADKDVTWLLLPCPDLAQAIMSSPIKLDIRDTTYESSCCGMPPLGGVYKIREGSYMGFCSQCKEATEFYLSAPEEED